MNVAFFDRGWMFRRRRAAFPKKRRARPVPVFIRVMRFALPCEVEPAAGDTSTDENIFFVLNSATFGMGLLRLRGPVL
jgi:hypothetical protein